MLSDQTARDNVPTPDLDDVIVDKNTRIYGRHRQKLSNNASRGFLERLQGIVSIDRERVHKYITITVFVLLTAFICIGKRSVKLHECLNQRYMNSSRDAEEMWLGIIGQVLSDSQL